jgi:hypothetical protein
VLDEVHMQGALQDLLTRNHRVVSCLVGLARENDGSCAVIKLRPSSSTQHLHDLKVAQLLDSVLCKCHGALQHHSVAREVDTDSQSRSATNDSQVALEEVLLDGVAILNIEASMMKRDAELDDLLQLAVDDRDPLRRRLPQLVVIGHFRPFVCQKGGCSFTRFAREAED